MIGFCSLKQWSKILLYLSWKIALKINTKCLKFCILFPELETLLADWRRTEGSVPRRKVFDLYRGHLFPTTFLVDWLLRCLVCLWREFRLEFGDIFNLVSTNALERRTDVRGIVVIWIFLPKQEPSGRFTWNYLKWSMILEVSPSYLLK